MQMAHGISTTRANAARVARANEQIVGADDSALTDDAVKPQRSKAEIAALKAYEAMMIGSHVQDSSLSPSMRQMSAKHFVGGKWFELQTGHLHVYSVTTTTTPSNSPSRNDGKVVGHKKHGKKKSVTIRRHDGMQGDSAGASASAEASKSSAKSSSATTITSRRVGEHGFPFLIAKFGGTLLCGPKLLVLAQPIDACSAVHNHAVCIQ